MRRPLLFASFCLVAVIALIYYGGPSGQWVGPPDGIRLTVTGQVCDKDEDSFDLKILTILNEAAILQQDNSNSIKNSYEDYNQCLNQYKTLLCAYEDSQTLILGAQVTLEGTFYTFSHATNPGEFDYADYYHSMGYLGKLRDVEIQKVHGEAGLKEGLYQLRQFWKNRLYTIFPSKEASVMAAILLGEKSDVDREIKDLYQRNGIVHILSISGFHITIIGMGIYKLLRRMGMPVWVASICGGTVLILYGMMTGFGVSVCRAIGMYLLRMLALLIGRTYDMLTALGVVGVVMVLMYPAWLGNMGYLLSFGSVLGLGFLLPALSKSGEKAMEPKPGRYVDGRLRKWLVRVRSFLWGVLREGLLAGVAITLTTLPIQLWFSYEISIYSVFLNALILPLMGVVMVAGLVAMMVPGLGIVGTVDVVILAGYEGLCYVFEGLPAAMWNPGRPALWQVTGYYLLWSAAVWGAPRLRRWMKGGKERWRWVFGLQFVLLTVAVGILALPGFHGDRVIFLDVGQGDCICVQTSSGEVYLFDCGSSSRTGIGENVLLPCLKYYGISEITAVFASHGDADHTNGLEEFLQQAKTSHMKVGQLVLPKRDSRTLAEEFSSLLETAGAADVPVSVIAAGERWTRGEDTFLCLHPDGEAAGGNAASQCFYIELREGDNKLSIVLTGDVEDAGETALLSQIRQWGIANVSVLKVAHHGSKYSTSEKLLEVLRPGLAVISCGRKNSYGHPHAETMERLSDCGAVILTTPDCGAITVELQQNGVKILPFRQNEK